MEQWADIAGYKNKYQISTLGRVKALTYRQTQQEHLICIKDNKGYKEVALWKNAKREMKQIHRLVAEAFIPNPNGFPCVNHRDEDKSNNNITNLEWCTVAYNNTYGSRLERIKNTKTNTAG